MTKFKLGLAAAAAAVLAFGVAACGQTSSTPEETPAATTEPAAPPADAMAPAAPADGAMAPAAPADGAAPAAPAPTTP